MRRAQFQTRKLQDTEYRIRINGRKRTFNAKKTAGGGGGGGGPSMDFSIATNSQYYPLISI